MVVAEALAEMRVASVNARNRAEFDRGFNLVFKKAIGQKEFELVLNQ